MNVGDVVVETPTIDCPVGIDDTGPRKCRVVYIHSEGRFYRVEFCQKETGATWRECYYFPERRGNPKANRTLKADGLVGTLGIPPGSRRDYCVKVPKLRGGIYDTIKQ